MFEQHPVGLPVTGEYPIERVAYLLQHAPSAFGTSPIAILRSVRWWRDGRWANLGTLLHAAAPTDREPDRDMKIGPVRFLSRPVNLADIADVGTLARLLNHWPGLDEHTPGELQQSAYPHRFSSARVGATHPGWQINAHVRNDPLQLDDSSMPAGPVFNPAAGFFAPTIEAALDKWLGPHADHRRNQLVIDDRRAAIRLVKHAENQITVHAELLGRVDVHACARLTDFRGRTEDHVVRVEDGVARVSAANAIQEFTVFLMDADPGWLDQRDSRSVGASPTTEGADTPEVTALVQLHADRDAGEGEEVEFKEWIPPTGEQGKYRQLLDAVSAFANGRGGRIYVGIDDRGGIQGLDVRLRKEYVGTEGPEPNRWRDAYARRLKQNVAEGIAPEVRPMLEWIDVAGRSVLRITVPPGSRAPHEVTETREIYVRRGATSRRPSPVELRTLFFADESPRTAAALLQRSGSGKLGRWR